MSKFFASRTGVLTAKKLRRLEERQLEVQLPLQSTCCSYSRPCLLNTHTQCAHAGQSSSRPGRQQPAPPRSHDTATTDSKTNKLSPRRGRRDDMPPPADASSTRGGSTSVRERVRSPHMAKLQAASVPIAQGSCAPRAHAPWDRQTDGSRYRLMPPTAVAEWLACWTQAQ